MPILKEKPILGDFQQYVVELKKERGFEDDANQAFIRLVEEIGEVAEKMRDYWQAKKNKKEFDPSEMAGEMADCLIYFFDLSNQLGIDLEKAFRDKEEINKKRTWER